jgi:hypothetical protein
MSLAPGDTVAVRMTKWGGRAHWEFSCVYLGTDSFGDWLGIPVGTVMTRPGAEYVAVNAQVGLVPPMTARVSDRGWLATFHAPGAPLFVYVDVTAPPYWHGTTLHAVDLDLDVVRRADGEVFVDDEDEFADHQVQFGYPPDVVREARSSADRLVELIGGAHPPYDDSSAAWFDRLADLHTDSSADRRDFLR